MSTKRRTYSEQYRLNAVKLVTVGGYRISDAASSLGIAANFLDKWKKSYEENGQHAFAGKGRLTPEAQELAGLRNENQRLRLERDIYKRAATPFTNESK